MHFSQQQQQQQQQQAGSQASKLHAEVFCHHDGVNIANVVGELLSNQQLTETLWELYRNAFCFQLVHGSQQPAGEKCDEIRTSKKIKKIEAVNKGFKKPRT